MTTSPAREQLLVELAARVLALPTGAARLVAVDGMSGVGKTTLAAEVAVVVSGAGRPVVPISYDAFHQATEVRRRQDRLSAAGYLEDSYDPAALRRLVIDPARAGAPVVPGSHDLAADVAVSPTAVGVPLDGVVIVEGEFLLGDDLGDAWDLGVLLVAEPTAVLARAVVRDADLGSPEQVRELYLRRYLGAWSLYEERQDPWSRADVVVDLTDPDAPRLLG